VSTLGNFALLAALVVAAYGLVAGLSGLRRGDDALLESSRRALVVWAAFTALASAVLLAALLMREFSIRYVAETSSRDLPLFYTVTAFWGGHAGSLLLWALVLGIYGVAAAARLRRSADAPVVFLVLLATAAFFTLTLVLGSNPFATQQIPPPDGGGLNPLLRNPWMAVHPPALYLGFVGTAVPFALVVASLVRGTGARWLETTRAWMRPVWLFLTLGLLFGAKWSYVVLGWGGYWAWDPVENAALMPWLTSTAFLHSAQVHAHDGSLGGWTRALVLLTFLLAILGTFLTRSGVLSSVHAFANSTVGVYFLVFLATACLGSVTLLLLRGRTAGHPAPDSTLLGRETAFLVNNVLFVVAVAAVLFGTLFPILAEAATGDRINVGPPYFNQVMVPIVVLLLLLMAVGPLLSWRRTHPQVLGRLLAAPAAAGVLSALAADLTGLRRPLVLLFLALCVFVAATIVGEFARGARPWRVRGEGWPAALLRLTVRGRTRYGGYIVHLGVLFMLAAIAVSSAFATRTQVTVAPGERFRLGRYEVQYDGIRAVRGPGLLITEARLTASDGRTSVLLRTRYLLHVNDQATAEVAIRSTWRDDLYLVLVGLTADRRATFRAQLAPGVAWLWAGALVALAGGVLTAAPLGRRAAVPQSVAEAVAVPGGGG